MKSFKVLLIGLTSRVLPYDRDKGSVFDRASKNPRNDADHFVIGDELSRSSSEKLTVALLVFIGLGASPGPGLAPEPIKTEGATVSFAGEGFPFSSSVGTRSTLDLLKTEPDCDCEHNVIEIQI